MTSRLAGIIRAAPIAIVLILAACGTPEAVKTLSQAQLDAFDAAVKSSKTQSEAIVELARKVLNLEIEKFAAERAKARQDAVAELANESDYESALMQAFDSGAIREQATAELKATLETNIEKIEEHSKRLISLIQEMKQAQAAIHQYLETEAVGEKLSNEMLGNQVISAALGSASRLVTEVNETSEELETTIKAFIED